MADNITVTMFHVTFEHNLADIVNSGGLVPGGSKQGMSELSGRDGFATDSVDKVFVTTRWFTVVRYINHATMRAEADGLSYIPVVLRIDVPLTEFQECYRDHMFPDETDQVPDEVSGEGFPTSGSYFMDTTVLLSHLKLSVQSYDSYSEDGSGCRWVDLAGLDIADGQYHAGGERVLPAVPDLPREGVTTNIDLNAAVNEQMKTLGDAIAEANSRIRSNSA